MIGMWTVLLLRLGRLGNRVKELPSRWSGGLSALTVTILGSFLLHAVAVGRRVYKTVTEIGRGSPTKTCFLSPSVYFKEPISHYSCSLLKRSGSSYYLSKPHYPFCSSFCHHLNMMFTRLSNIIALAVLATNVAAMPVNNGALVSLSIGHYRIRLLTISRPISYRLLVLHPPWPPLRCPPAPPSQVLRAVLR